MSNVLIGIIGVILFIGLALAGALFLGPRFQEAAISSKASASVQVLSQVSQAARLYQVQEGLTVSPNASGTGLETPSEPNHQELVVGGYLKAIPANPTNTGGVFIQVDEQGRSFAIMSVGVDDDKVCRYINRQGSARDTADVRRDDGTARIGCQPQQIGDAVYSTAWEQI